MEIGIIQPSLDPFKKFKEEETKNIYGDTLYTQFTISSKNSNSN